MSATEIDKLICNSIRPRTQQRHFVNRAELKLMTDLSRFVQSRCISTVYNSVTEVAVV